MSFKKFEIDDIVLSSDPVSSPIWSGDLATLSSAYTSSTQKEGFSGQYYLDVYDKNPDDLNVQGTPKVQFAITYGNKYGSGSLNYNQEVDGKSPSSTIYGQYRSMVLGDEDDKFTFGAATAVSGEVKEEEAIDFFVISLDRARFKEKLIPGTLTLVLSSKEDADGNVKKIHITDNSKEIGSVRYIDSGRVYDLVSGSGGAVYKDGNNASYGPRGTYGYLLPDIGTLIINAEALRDTGSFGLGLELAPINGITGVADSGDEDGSTIRDSYMGLITEFYNSLVETKVEESESGEVVKTKLEFTIQSEETVTSNYIFVRVKNSEFNYSTNPSNITGSGELRHSIMINSPQAYITTVGLYNDSNDLLAVAKLSRPLIKDFTKEALIRIKLNY